jgi:UDP-N-acetylglucosamine 2-epimerase
MLLLSYGTRPEYIKLQPIIKKLNEGGFKYELLFTGQHKDIVNQKASRVISILDGENRLDSIVSSILNKNTIFEGISHVMVQGDTTSAFAIALAAYHRQIKIIHLEAGLRTWNESNPYPEEGNRRFISCMANIHFCPTKTNQINLLTEAVSKEIYVVGNTIIDNLIKYKNDISYSNEILITLHRRENHPILDVWFKTLSDLAKIYTNHTFTLPLHPNPNVQKHKHLLTNINVIEPLQYENMIEKLARCKCIISDSGGIQEEASFFKKRIIVCRKVTERPESLGVCSVMCPHPNELSNLLQETLSNYRPSIEYECPYGDGTASEKIVYILRAKHII